jgi:hypothetical protein
MRSIPAPGDQRSFVKSALARCWMTAVENRPQTFQIVLAPVIA